MGKSVCNLREIREGKGLTQEDLAFMFREKGQQLTTRAISRLENGKGGAHLRTIRLLCEVLGVTPKKLGVK